MTILVLKDGKATLVFNQTLFVENVRQTENETTFTLCANTVEYYDDGTPMNNADIKVLSIKGDMLYFK